MLEEADVEVLELTEFVDLGCIEEMLVLFTRFSFGLVIAVEVVFVFVGLVLGIDDVEKGIERGPLANVRFVLEEGLSFLSLIFKLDKGLKY